MNVSELLLKKPKLALIAAAVAVVLSSNTQAQDVDRENANRSQADQSQQIARSDTGMQSLEQHLQSNTLRVSKVVGMEVQNRSGDNLGEVRDIARNAAPGQDMQLIVALGGGSVADDQKLVAIPFDEVQISADGDELYTTRTREQLAGLPAVTIDQRTTGAGDAAANRGGAAQPGAAGEPRATAQATTSLRERRVGDLVGAEVVGSGGEKVGEIDDVILSTAGADTVRAVLQVGGVAGIGEKRISLPLSQITVERAGDDDEPTLRVAQNAEALERMPEFKYEEDTEAL